MDSTTSTPDTAASPTLLFRVGDGVFGCDVADAQEIIPLRDATRLPGAPPFVRGLINVRGTIVTVLDLGQRLDPTREPMTSGSIVLVRHDDHLVGLAVDEVADVRVLAVEEEAELTGNDASRAGVAGTIVRGIAVAPANEGEEGADPMNVSDAATIVVLDLVALIEQVLLS